MENNMIIAIDLGTSRSRVVAGVPAPEMPYGLNILYSDDMKSLGMKRGAVISKDEVSKVLINLLSAVEKNVTKKKGQKNIVLVSMGGQSFGSSIIKASMPIDGGKITMRTLQAIEKKARAEKEQYAMDEDVLHTNVISYSIDNVLYNDDVINREGENLEAKFQCMSGKNKAIATLRSAFAQRYSPASFYPTASSKAGLQLTTEQRRKGVVLVDLGFGTTSVACYFHDSLIYEASVPIGSDTITNDIATGLGISHDDAEELKCNFGMLEEGKASKTYKVSMSSGETIEFEGAKLNFIIKARVEELGAYVYSVANEAQKRGACAPRDMKIALTGGGSKLIGINKIFANQTDMTPTNPTPINVDNVEADVAADYATAIGMASIWARENREQQPSLPFADDIPEPQPVAEPEPKPAPQPEPAPQPQPAAPKPSETEKPKKEKKSGLFGKVRGYLDNLMDDDLNSKDE